ncbi:UspA domain protein [Haladaptatus paucihalophilus DX253]|uniref:Nucleotide-binding universal stress protein, UspA family n=1 Tax=Haladaptatus paucihalophilus DX253 TaxID=797209 RepID=E7QNB8_HALPU|nr:MULTISPECIES: universal stress protein [Haladaptatus]EFW93913.1 UspA domain protein [Haladaptatus paucihalophilus DX253]GKZ13213.1 universal stress protein UspA [Haladaptatus sp. T7]SHK67006.1 Nucleotide-binding universal stress protein, UspA family [Haladaptatus paucihalophilus DX253]
MGEHVLVPLDGSPKSVEAFEYAASMPDVELTLITIVNPFDIDPLSPGYQSPIGKSGMPAYSQEWYQEEWDNAHELHEELGEQANVPVESVVKMGQPARQILVYARENDVDHIVIGTHGKDDISKIILGSVADKVMRRAPMMVTVVR